MLGFVIRLLITAGGLWLADVLVAGISIAGPFTLVIAALLLGIVNAFVRPLIVFLTLPLTVVTLGLFLLIVNGMMLGLVAALLNGFHVSGIGAATLGALIVSVTGWIASWYIGPTGRVEILVVRR